MVLKHVSLSLLLFGSALASTVHGLELNKGDRISLIGNTLAERMQYDGWLETLIQMEVPEYELSFRNLGFSGDEVTFRANSDGLNLPEEQVSTLEKDDRGFTGSGLKFGLRSAGFGSIDDFLYHTKTDVVFAFFGYNESYAGEEGLARFKNSLADVIEHMRRQNYNGQSPPRIVFFSPIAHENLHDRNLPTGEENNARLETYTKAMADVCRELDVDFVDLFTPTRALFARPLPHTINGVHLNSRGNLVVARLIAEALIPSASLEDWSDDGSEFDQEGAWSAVREAVLDKNFHWYHRYRTTDGYSVYGGRSYLKFVEGQTNRVVAQRELEILDVMTANRDDKIWALAAGRDHTVDDSNTPEFVAVETNKPGSGPNGAHLFNSGQDAIEQMQLADGLEVSLFADEEMFPELANPVQMAFDTKGRLWVATMQSYPHWKPKDKLADKLLIFEDIDGDGKADEMKVFADDLHVPTGLEFCNGGVIVGQQPNLEFLQDTDGDDKADVRVRLLHGIDSADTHHALNSFVLSPGGALFFQEGTFHHTQVETPYGPSLRNANAGAYRYEPRTHKLDLYINYGFANPHGHVFDRWGQDFLTDGTGNVNYFVAPFSGRLDYPAKHSRYFPFFQQMFRPCPATEIVSSSHFPEDWQGDYLDVNVIGFLGIYRYDFEDDGSGFRGVEVEPVIQSTDQNFRPVDVEIGPDGALWFVDWQNPIIGHMQHNLRDPSRDKTHGRIYRITHKERPLQEPVAIDGESIESLVELLAHPIDRIRYRAKIELSERDSDEVISAVNAWVEKLDKSEAEYEHHMLEALWVHQWHNVVDRELLERMLRSPDFRARAAATRVTCYWRDQLENPLDLLETQSLDEHPRVRLEAVRACSFFEDARAATVALNALNQPTDKFIDYCLNETLRALEPYWRAALQGGAEFATQNPKGIEYLLDNVSNQDLIKLPRNEPVYAALLTRDGIPHDYRHEALMGLAEGSHHGALGVLLDAMKSLDKSNAPEAGRILSDLAHLFTMHSGDHLDHFRTQVETLALNARMPITRRIAYVTLISADGTIDNVWQQAMKSPDTLQTVLEAIPLIPEAEIRAAAHEKVVPLISGLPPQLAAQIDESSHTVGRTVRITLPGSGRTLTLAEVEVFSRGRNVARGGKAKQSSTGHGGVASRGIDGNKDGRYASGGQTHTAENRRNAWWEVDLGKVVPIDSIVIWNRSEGDGQYAQRLNGFRVTIKDGNGRTVFEQSDIPAPLQSHELLLGGDPAAGIRQAAIAAISYTGVDPQGTFARLSALVGEEPWSDAAVSSLSRIPQRQWPRDQIPGLVNTLIEGVQELSPEERTEDTGLDMLALARRLTVALPRERANEVRKQLRQLGVTVIQLRPVPHKMIYDRSQIFVEAGSDVQVVFENIDVMPHNLVFTAPGAMAKVGIAAEEFSTDPSALERGYVPDMSEVMQATRLLQPGQTDRLRFKAPTELGEYPYVCTYPGHWRKMYGTMHVVASLDDVSPEALAPSVDTEIQATRDFIKNWQLAELEPGLASAGKGRNLQRGAELFKAVSCVQCHRIGDAEGGQVGPNLADTREKMKKENWTRARLLKEILEPSANIDEKFQTMTIIDLGGRVHTGVVLERTDQFVRLAANPLDPGGVAEIKIPLDDIDEEFPGKLSLMPQALLNTLTQDEVYDLLWYVAGNEE